MLKMPEPATEAQLAMIRRLGLQAWPDMTKGEAWKMIQQKKEGVKPKDVSNEYSQARQTSSPPGLDKDTLIIRQSCLKAAVEMTQHLDSFLTQRGVSPVTVVSVTQTIKEVAEEFEKWVTRE